MRIRIFELPNGYNYASWEDMINNELKKLDKYYILNVRIQNGVCQILYTERAKIDILSYIWCGKYRNNM